MKRRYFLTGLIGVASLPVVRAFAAATDVQGRPMIVKIERSEAEWRQLLTPPQFRVLREEQYQLRHVLGDVRTGVDVEAFQPPAEPAAAPVIGFLGSMDWMPNIDGVLGFAREVLPKVREQMPEVRVKIIGRNPPASIRALASDPAIELTGTVPEVQPHVHECCVIAVPLLAGGGTRIKIFEAMAMGVPVISTTIGAEGLPVRHGEEIEIADETESFAKGTLKLLADAGAASRMASNAQKNP